MGRSFLFAFSAAMHLWVGWMLVPSLMAWPFAAGILALLIAVSAVLMPLGLLVRRAHGTSEKIADRLAWAGMLFMGLFSSLFVFTLLRELVYLGTWTVQRFVPAVVLPPDFGSASAWGVLVVSFAATALGFLNARRTAKVVTVDVPVEGLPPALDGFTIAQISDIHVGPTIKAKYLQAIVDRVNALDADAVAVTGDLIDGSVRQLAPHVAPLSQLKSRHGTYFVAGNHEYYSGAHAWIDHLRSIGVNVLMNEHVVLQHRDARLVLAGVTDYTAHLFDAAHRSDPAKALIDAPADAGARVLLAHQPRSAEAASSVGFDVQLSGHTHGGQFWPWNHFVRFQQPFTAGLHRLGRLWVYTSRGTGYWGPPKRFGAPSEITRLRLRAA